MKIAAKKQQKETTVGRKKAVKTNPYAEAQVINLSTTNAEMPTAPRICATTGRYYKDVAAIRSILELMQKAHPDAVIANQNFWEGDKLVITVAKSIGMNTEELVPKFIEARRRQAPLFDEGHRMTPEENAEVGFVELQKRLATTCSELHIFGTPSGPQRGLKEAFEEVDKEVFMWGGATS